MNPSPINVKVLRLVKEQKEDTGAIGTIWRTMMETVRSNGVKWWLGGYKEKWKEELGEEFTMTNA